MTVREFALPDLGEGLTESELVEWHVAVGDLVALNQPIAEVETAKAIVQLPSPFAGTVAELFVEPGSTVAVGARIASFSVDDAADVAVESPAASKPERTSVLVGYGPTVETSARPTRKARKSMPAPREATIGDPDPQVDRAMSTPPVRKLAHDLGIDLTGIAGSGERGMITRDDVLSADGLRHSTDSMGTDSMPADAKPADSRAPGRGEALREVRVPIRGVRKATAAAMVSSAFTAPHVTEFLTIDVTPTVELIAKLRAEGTGPGHRVGMLAVVAKAVCIAAKRTPSINSAWDGAAGEIVEFGYVNLGIAVATPRGLIVPHIPDADSLSLAGLADAIATLAESARAGETTQARLSGGTISITNVGVFGVDAGTPILNPGEAAILAMGAVRRTPWEFRGGIALRDVMTLSLSFDHRLVDGEQGSGFLTDVGAILADPGMVMTMV